MRIDIERLTQDQQLRLRPILGEGLWDHILSGEDLPEAARELVVARLKRAGYPVPGARRRYKLDPGPSSMNTDNYSSLEELIYAGDGKE